MNLAGRRRNHEPLLAFQPDLLGAPSGMPEGFRYLGDILSAEEEDSLARELEALPFKPFDFHGYEANRRVVGFGFRYDYSRREVVEAPPVPSFLEPLRLRIGEAFDRPAETFEQILINEYRPGAGIGWRRDKPHFTDVVGVSLRVRSKVMQSRCGFS
jgi:alkylated DNA repair dioxygenase AlkB